MKKHQAKSFQKVIRVTFFLIFFLLIATIFFPVSGHAANKNISSCNINMPYSSIQYTGYYNKPVPVIKDGTSTLQAEKDFTLTYSKNKLPGTASVTIKGIGNYTGSVSKTFSITKKPIKNCKIILDPPFFIYDGKAKIPTVTIKNGSSLLTRNASYSLQINNNKNFGLACIKIVGKGNYTGTTEVTFPIGPADVKLKTSSSANSSITFSWTAIANCDGYYLYKYNSAKKTYTKTATIAKNKCSYTINNLTCGTTYTYAIKAYKVAGKVTIQSQNYCLIKKTTTMPSVKSLTVTESLYDSIHLSWPKITGASGYVIFSWDYNKKVFTRIKEITWNASSCVLQNLKSGTKYGLAIKAYHKNGTTNVFSPVAVKVSATTSNSYKGKTLFVCGDSIAYGTGAGGYSYANALTKTYGFSLSKHTTPGASLADSYKGTQGNKEPIVTTVKNQVKKTYNYAIVEGGINDYFRSVPPGTISSSSSYKTGTFNTGTSAGALEYIFSYFRENYPATKLYFLIPHKIFDNGSAALCETTKSKHFDDVWKIPNKVNLTYKDYYTIFRNICTKYNVTLINMYVDSHIDATKKADRDMYTASGDGIHPTKDVQINVYAPRAAKIMGLK